MNKTFCFEKINKTDKLIAELMNKQREKTQITKIMNKSRHTAINLTVKKKKNCKEII